MAEQQTVMENLEGSPYLKDVPSDQIFILSNGIPISNLRSLLNIIKNTYDSLFYSHVNDSKNDFANWIRACIKHESLSNNLMTIRQKKPFIEIMEKEIMFLENPQLQETAKFFEEDMGENKAETKGEMKEVKVAGVTSQEVFQDVETLDFEQFLEPLIRELETEMSQSEQ